MYTHSTVTSAPTYVSRRDSTNYTQVQYNLLHTIDVYRECDMANLFLSILLFYLGQTLTAFLSAVGQLRLQLLQGSRDKVQYIHMTGVHMYCRYVDAHIVDMSCCRNVHSSGSRVYTIRTADVVLCASLYIRTFALLLLHNCKGYHVSFMIVE